MPIVVQPLGVFGVLVSSHPPPLDPSRLSDEDFAQVQELLYTHSLVLWRGVQLSPVQQYQLTRRFDPASEEYGHAHQTSGLSSKSVLATHLKSLPVQPQVQLIGNGQVVEEAVAPALKPLPLLEHPHHRTFHKTHVSPEDEQKGVTRFYRWHIDAALYAVNPPRVTTLQALKVPQGPEQICRYDDGTGDELKVPLGTTAFVSGQVMFEILPPELKSFAVRAKVQYAPHPYVWMSGARARSTGLGMESEGKELPRDQLPDFEESKIKTLPLLWKNPCTGLLHLQVHPSGAEKLIVDPLPATSGQKRDSKQNALFPDGGVIDDLAQVRELLYRIQRPGIAPNLVYAHDWKEGDLCLFHNRGVLHSVVGAFKPDQHRAFWQCNIAGSDEPKGPDADDVHKYA